MNAIFSAAIWSDLTNTMKLHKWCHDVIKNDAEWYKTMQICTKKRCRLVKNDAGFPKNDAGFPKNDAGFQKTMPTHKLTSSPDSWMLVFL